MAGRAVHVPFIPQIVDGLADVEWQEDRAIPRRDMFRCVEHLPAGRDAHSACDLTIADGTVTKLKETG